MDRPFRVILIAAVALTTGIACNKYDRPESVPEYGGYWFDAPFDAELDAREAALGAALGNLYPVVQHEVCAPGDNPAIAQALAGQCEISAACLDRVVHGATAATVQTYNQLGPAQRLDILAVVAASHSHVESVLVPGLTRDEMKEVVGASCEQSPTPELFQTDGLAMYSDSVERQSLCDYDWTYTSQAIDTFRRTLLRARAEGHCASSDG